MHLNLVLTIVIYSFSKQLIQFCLLSLLLQTNHQLIICCVYFLEHGESTLKRLIVSVSFW